MGTCVGPGLLLADCRLQFCQDACLEVRSPLWVRQGGTPGQMAPPQQTQEELGNQYRPLAHHKANTSYAPSEGLGCSLPGAGQCPEPPLMGVLTRNVDLIEGVIEGLRITPECEPAVAGSAQEMVGEVEPPMDSWGSRQRRSRQLQN